MLLHSIIPHAHKSEVNSIEHAQIHQSETTSTTDFLALLFHEFTEEGEMEEVLIQTNSLSLSSPSIVLIVALVNFNDLSLSNEQTKEQPALPLPFEKLQQLAGFSTAWSIRPPPFA